MVRQDLNNSTESVSIPMEDDKHEIVAAIRTVHDEDKIECVEISLDADHIEKCTNIIASSESRIMEGDNSLKNVQVGNINIENVDENVDTEVNIIPDSSDVATGSKDETKTNEINDETVILPTLESQIIANENDGDRFEKEVNSDDNCLFEGYGILNKSFSTSTMEMNNAPYYEVNKRSSYIYPVIVDDIEISANSTTTKSTSLPDISSRMSVVQPTQKICSCDCHSNHSNKSSHSNRRNLDAPSYYDVIATSSHHTNCHANDLILDLNQLRASPTGTPGNTPGRVRRKFPSQMVKIFNSRNPSPTSMAKGLPNYRSLIFSILKDEPPKYEDVTGKKLADELIGYGKDDRPSQPPGPGFVRNALKRRLIGIAALLVVIMFTFIVLYLSATIVGKRNSNVDRKTS